MAKIQFTILAETAQAIIALQQVAGAVEQIGKSFKDIGTGIGFDSAEKSTNGFLDKLKKIPDAAKDIVSFLQDIKDTAAVVLGPGFEFNKTMEQNQLGMAGILQSMTLIDGKTVDFNQAMAISSDMMKKLQQDAVRTATSTEELAEVFRGILAPGINAGMTLDQIREITVVGTSAAKTLGVPREQIVQQMTDIIQGGVGASGSTLANSLGLTDTDIEKAKNSSEGLFKFLTDRMKGIADTSKEFPDTMQGRIDKLQEVFTQGSAAFVSQFEDPIKTGLSAISDSIGEVDEVTGEIHFNPAFASAAEEVNGILSEMMSLGEDLAPSFSWIEEDVVPACNDLWGSLKDIGSMIGDSLRIVLKETKPIIDIFAEGFRDLARYIKEATGWLADWFDASAKKTGVKSSKPVEMAEVRHSEDSNTKPSAQESSGKVTSKYQNSSPSQHVNNYQNALKIALAVIEDERKQAIEQINKEKESIDISYKQFTISAEDYERRKTELEMRSQQVSVDAAQKKLDATQGTVFDKDSEKKVAVDKARDELNTEIGKLEKIGSNLDDVNRAINAMNGTSHNWRKEVENVNTEGLQDNTKAAIDILANYFYEQTGQKMVVSSGLRTQQSHPEGPGGHISGTKFDVVDAGDSRLLEDNVNGIRDKLIDYAKSLGLKILDAYAGDEGPDAPGHLDFNAKDFTTTFTAQAKARIGKVMGKSGLEYLNAILELMGEADEIAKSLAEDKGDISSWKKAELSSKYSDLIKKFQVNKMTDSVKDVQELQNAEFLKIDFSQAQKTLEVANAELAEKQQSLMNDFATGTRSASKVTEEYTDEYKKQTDPILSELQRIIDSAGSNKELINAAKGLKHQIVEGEGKIFDAINQRIDTELQNKISMINADRKLTSRQRQDLIDEETRKAHANKAAEYTRQVDDLKNIDEKNNNHNNAAKIIDLETLAELNRKLSETPTLLEQIQEVSKQTFEDGLLDFLERGVFECKNLADAFLNLASSVLQSIQKVYAEALTKNIMSLLGLGATEPKKSVLGTTDSTGFYYEPNFGVKPLFSFAEGGSIDSGKVTGPGTETSDSILAWAGNIKKFIRIANGEFVLRGAAVKKYGTAFLERLNSGIIPSGMLQRYAIGGSLTDRIPSGSVIGPQELTANLSNNTTIPLNIMNVVDQGMMGKFLQTREGKKALLNYIKDDAGTIRRVLNIPG